jgi:antitoxin HicB
MVMEYPATLERDDDTILVSFTDFPEVHTFGSDALEHGRDALATILDAYIKDRRPIPAPSQRRSKYRIAVPALIDAKIRLYEAMRTARVTKSELGRRLQVHPPQIDRLLAMTHGSPLGQLEAAFAALGKRLVIDVVDAPLKKGGRA